MITRGVPTVAVRVVEDRADGGGLCTADIGRDTVPHEGSLFGSCPDKAGSMQEDPRVQPVEADQCSVQERVGRNPWAVSDRTHSRVEEELGRRAIGLEDDHNRDSYSSCPGQEIPGRPRGQTAHVPGVGYPAEGFGELLESIRGDHGYDPEFAQ